MACLVLSVACVSAACSNENVRDNAGVSPSRDAAVAWDARVASDARVATAPAPIVVDARIDLDAQSTMGATAADAGSCEHTTDAGYRICCGRETEIPGVSCVDLSKPGGEFGNFGRCLTSGEAFDAKFGGAVCCVGLVRSELLVEEDGGMLGPPPGGCGADGPLSTKVCLPCGNGSCNEGENSCNCPSDCRPK
jgi:hypothetical protein